MKYAKYYERLKEKGFDQTTLGFSYLATAVERYEYHEDIAEIHAVIDQIALDFRVTRERFEVAVDYTITKWWQTQPEVVQQHGHKPSMLELVARLKCIDFAEEEVSA